MKFSFLLKITELSTCIFRDVLMSLVGGYKFGSTVLAICSCVCVRVCVGACARVYLCITRQQDSQLQQHLPDTHSSSPTAHVHALLTQPLHQLHSHIATPVKSRCTYDHSIAQVRPYNVMMLTYFYCMKALFFVCLFLNQ